MCAKFLEYRNTSAKPINWWLTFGQHVLWYHTLRPRIDFGSRYIQVVAYPALRVFKTTCHINHGSLNMILLVRSVSLGYLRVSVWIDTFSATKHDGYN